MEKKKATKNVWLYAEDYDTIAKEVKYGEKFADALERIIKEGNTNKQ
jgi:hypothetical protein